RQMSVADPSLITQQNRDLAATAAALLDQRTRADGLSRLLTAAALVMLMLLPVLWGQPAWLLPVILVLVAMAGLAEIYLAVRVGFDAALFRQIASNPNGFDLERLDWALTRLELVAEVRAGRSIDARVAGAR